MIFIFLFKMTSNHRKAREGSLHALLSTSAHSSFSFVGGLIFFCETILCYPILKPLKWENDLSYQFYHDKRLYFQFQRHSCKIENGWVASSPMILSSEGMEITKILSRCRNANYRFSVTEFTSILRQTVWSGYCGPKTRNIYYWRLDAVWNIS